MAQHAWENVTRRPTALPSLRSKVFAHPKEDLCLLWLPRYKDPWVQLGSQGPTPQDHRHWPLPLPQDFASALQEWFPCWHHCTCPQEESLMSCEGPSGIGLSIFLNLSVVILTSKFRARARIS